jgi:hypothetical protein
MGRGKKTERSVTAISPHIYCGASTCINLGLYCQKKKNVDQRLGDGFTSATFQFPLRSHDPRTNIFTVVVHKLKSIRCYLLACYVRAGHFDSVPSHYIYPCFTG